MGIILALVLGFLVPAVPLQSAPEGMAAGPQRVLLLNSYHQGYLWTDEITRGVEETLAGADVELHIEYMDTKRQFDVAYQELLRQVLRHKHRKHRYAIIIASDNNAFDFMKSWGRSVFDATPVVFCGVNYLQKADVAGYENFTGVNEQMNIVGNLNLIHRLHPDCTKVVVVTDNTTTGKQNQKEVQRIETRATDAMPQIELLYDVSVDTLKTRMQGLDAGTVVLFTIFIRDKNDVFVGYEGGLKLVCDYTRVPVYAAQNFRTRWRPIKPGRFSTAKRPPRSRSAGTRRHGRALIIAT